MVVAFLKANVAIDDIAFGGSDQHNVGFNHARRVDHYP